MSASHLVGFRDPIAIHSGGQGEVWRAWQPMPGRHVCIKSGRDRAGIARLHREASLLARLAGLPIPALLAFDDPPGRMVLEWIDGVPLADLGPLGEEARRAVFLEACRSVARLHAASLVHGDLSPRNLLALPTGGISVVDFGLARLLHEPAPPFSGISGTWEILAPEMLRGAMATLASDVFALGLLALRLWGADLSAYRSSSDRWSNALLSGRVTLLGEDLPPPIRLALAVDPARRPTAAVLARSLGADWGSPSWPREIVGQAFENHLDRRLARAVEHARQVGDSAVAYTIQKERVERASDPEPLLPLLGELARERQTPSSWTRGKVLLAATMIATMMTSLGTYAWRTYATAHSPIDVPPPTAARDWKELYPSEHASKPGFRLDLPAHPPGSRLWVDDRPQPLPAEPSILLPPGTHRVELRDASNFALLDTSISVPDEGGPGSRL